MMVTLGLKRPVDSHSRQSRSDFNLIGLNVVGMVESHLSIHLASAHPSRFSIAVKEAIVANFVRMGALSSCHCSWPSLSLAAITSGN
eukprot:6212629-Pleurochrysis_carterae.AAC.2